MPARYAASDLRELQLFAGATDEQCDRARSLLTALSLAEGAVLWRAGQLGRDFGIVADGLLGVIDPEGFPVGVIGPGEIVGELALLGGRIRRSTVITMQPTLLYAGNAREFHSLLELVPTARDRVLHTAFTRLGR